MRIFEEEQGFNRVWLIVIGTISFLGWLYLLYFQVQEEQNSQDLISFLLFSLLYLLIYFLFFCVKLKTRIDSRGVYAGFSPPGFFKKFFRWEEIKEIYVREYSPIAEYGGWGIRGLGRTKAYNVSGKYGIQIFTRENKDFLIGTQVPEKARRVLFYFKDFNKTAEQ